MEFLNITDELVESSTQNIPFIPMDLLTSDIYQGPTYESNWVIPGYLMAGAYPNKEEIKQILDKGINVFVSLQHELGGLNAPRYEACLPEDIIFEHLPIPDRKTTDDNLVIPFVQKLAKYIQDEKILYVHCWGGHGRTGTIVSILLHLLWKINPEESMAYCQKTHDLRKLPVTISSPETPDQREQVTRIIESFL